jgi:hypothetical protein
MIEKRERDTLRVGPSFMVDSAYSRTGEMFGARTETLPAELNSQNNLQFLP